MRIVSVGNSTEKYADIDDFPYLAIWKELDAHAIYTTDPHIAAMGLPWYRC
jgi:hypothetical protein